jgi:hypothetical protein
MSFMEFFYVELSQNAENIFYFLIILNVIFFYFFLKSLMIENENEN